MKLLNFNKKGQAENYLAVVIFIFVFGFIAILCYALLNNITTEFSSTGLLPPGDDNGQKFLNGIALHDYIIVLLMVVLIVAVGITSFKLATAPIFFIITFIMSAFYGFVSFFFNFIFSQLVSDALFTATLLHFPKTVLICTNFHWIMFANIIIGSITLYAKKQQGQFE